MCNVFLYILFVVEYTKHTYYKNLQFALEVEWWLQLDYIFLEHTNSIFTVFFDETRLQPQPPSSPTPKKCNATRIVRLSLMQANKCNFKVYVML